MTVTRPIYWGFFVTLLGGVYINLSANTWLGCWVGLEINLMSFVPMILMKHNSLSAEAALKYFLVQAFGSVVLLYGIILLGSNHIDHSEGWVPVIMILALLWKMGAAPFHQWVPHVIQGLSWFQCVLLLTVQKLAPLSMVWHFHSMVHSFVGNIVILSSIMSAMVGAVGGFNQVHLRKLLAYSSINQVGWMLSAALLDEFTFFCYLFTYFIALCSIVFVFYKCQVYHVGHLYAMPMTSSTKFSLLVSFIALAGLPPFVSFSIKVWTLALVFNSLNLVWGCTLAMSSLITIHYYCRVTFTAFVISPIKLFSSPLKKGLNSFSLVVLILFNFIPSLLVVLVSFPFG